MALQRARGARSLRRAHRCSRSEAGPLSGALPLDHHRRRIELSGGLPRGAGRLVVPKGIRIVEQDGAACLRTHGRRATGPAAKTRANLAAFARRRQAQFDSIAGDERLSHFPPLVRGLPKFAGPFDAFRLEAADCEVLFASYPAGTTIAPHDHETENVGVITQ